MKFCVLSAIAMLFVTPLTNSQESKISNDPFDPYVGVLTWLSNENFTQSGSLYATSIEVNISTFRVRESGKVESYVKLQIEYPLQPDNAEISRRIDVDRASFKGGVSADFEKIDTDLSCVTTSFGKICKVTEVVSVRLPPNAGKDGSVMLQFRNRESTWRGVASFSGSAILENIKKLPR